MQHAAALSAEDLRTKKQQMFYEEAVAAGKRAPMYPAYESEAAASPRLILIEESSVKMQEKQKAYVERCEPSKDGFYQMTLYPGEGLRVLKKNIRRRYGKVPRFKIGPLVLVDGERAAKKSDLVDGVKLRCTYTQANGNVNMGLVSKRRFGRAFGGYSRYWDWSLM